MLREGVQGQDVTEEYSDLQARLRSHRALEERMLAILAKADSVEDALTVEKELVRVRSTIDEGSSVARRMLRPSPGRSGPRRRPATRLGSLRRAQHCSTQARSRPLCQAPEVPAKGRSKARPVAPGCGFFDVSRAGHSIG